MTDKERYVKRQSTGYRVVMHYANRSESLHFVLHSRAMYMAKFLKDSGRYQRITVCPVNSPWCAEEV